MTLRLVDVRSHDSLIINVDSATSDLKVSINTDDLETAADIVQDLVNGYLKKTTLMSTCSFPRINVKLNEIFEVYEQSNQLKMHFAANISENIQNIKVFTVRAEAGLMIDDIDSMRKNYAQVMNENGALLAEYKKRDTSHQELLKQLKKLNGLIRQASNLRIGLPSKVVVSQCRDCIKDNTLNKIIEIIEQGQLRQDATE